MGGFFSVDDMFRCVPIKEERNITRIGTEINNWTVWGFPGVGGRLKEEVRYYYTVCVGDYS